MASNARGDTETTASPRGIARHFWEPVMLTSTPHASVWTSSPASDDTVSRRKSAPWRRVISPTAPAGYVTPVEVSLCTRVTSFGRTFATTRSKPSRSIGLPSSTSKAVTAAPTRSMTSFIRLPKTPATTTTTRSPGSMREIDAASSPVRPEPGMAITSPEVWKIWRRSRHAGSRISSSNGGSYWIIAGCAIARMTRHGTSVGPGIIRIGRSSPRRQC